MPTLRVEVIEMKKALGIARVSTKRQSAADRVSHSEQEAKIRAWCEANGYEVIEVLHETVSRAIELDPLQRENRPVFWMIWDRLVAGEVQAIVFAEPTRFCAALDGADFVYWLTKSRDHADGIRFVEEEPPGDEEYGTVMAAVAGSKVSSDRKKLVKRMMEGREAHGERGEFPGGSLPFWLRWIKPVKEEGGRIKEPGRFELREQHVATMRRIIALYHEGLGCERIADVLTREGVASPSQVVAQWKGKARPGWNGPTILNALRNPALSGTYLTGGNRRGKKLKTRALKPLVLEVPAIIDREEFEDLQGRITRNRQYQRPLVARGWPLQGLIWSEACGFTYRCKCDGVTKRRVYRCPGRLEAKHRWTRKARCDCPSLPAEQMEGAVVEALGQMLSDPETCRKAVADYIGDLEGRKVALEARLAPCEGEIARLQGLIDDLTLDRRTGRLSPERYEKEIKGLESQRDALQTRRGDLTDEERELAHVGDSLAAIHQALDGEDLLQMWVREYGGKQYVRMRVADDDEAHDEPLFSRTESFAAFAQRLRLRVVVRADGQVEVRGFLAPTPIDIAHQNPSRH